MKTFVLLSVGTLFVLSCSPTGPSSTSQRIVAIEPALTGLRVGEVQQFQLMVTVDGIKSARTSVRWTTDRPEVCGVDPDGTVHASTLGSATITAVDDQYQGSVRIAVVPNTDGDWRGLAQFIGDRCLRGTCPQSRSFGPDVGQHEISLQQTHDRIMAVDKTTLVGQLFNLAGHVDESGLITLSGSRSLEGGRLDLNWTGQFEPTTQHITGHYEVTESLDFTKEFDFKILDLAR
jgi:hypothetical protein